MSTAARLAAPAVSTAERLAALNRTSHELFAELDRTPQESSDAVLSRWEDEALTAEERAARLVAEHLRLVNVWCQLDPGLTGVRRLSTTPPMWLLIGKDSTARATSTQLAEWRYAKVKLWDATGQVPELVETAVPGKAAVPIRWAKVWKALGNAAEAVDLGELGTERGQVREWLNSYFAGRPAPNTDKPTDATERHPYTDGGRLHVFATELLTHLRSVLKERITSKELRLLMHAADVEHDKINLTNTDGGPTSSTIYRLPQGWS